MQGWSVSPALQDGLKSGRGDGVVGGGEDVVRVSGGEVDAADEAAGVYVVLDVEGMGVGGEAWAGGLCEAAEGELEGLR